MKTDKIHIIFPGDESVGIFPARFELGPDLVFDDADHMAEFMAELADLFEQFITGYSCYCLTDEEFNSGHNQ